MVDGILGGISEGENPSNEGHQHENNYQGTKYSVIPDRNCRPRPQKEKEEREGKGERNKLPTPWHLKENQTSNMYS
jgi:hypothetical protein